ncbi:MAG: hypothetical protein OEL87_02520 [Nanoarchaeota archaeon]|nr:hypothetical protein [Nanoarchaeota archaeon]
MDECTSRHRKEREESFSLGFNFEKDVGLCESYYLIGRRVGRYVSNAKLLIFSGDKIADGNLAGFVGSLNDLRLFRDKYADHLSCDSLGSVDREIMYLEGVSRKAHVSERLEKILGDGS